MFRSIGFALGLGFSLGGCAGTAPLPPQAVALNRAGAEALAKGDLETADARFSLALEYSPRFVEALVNQGLLELQRGNFERARELLMRARRLNTDVAQPHHALGILAERQARPDEASRHYYDALAVDPGFAPSRAPLARLLFDAGMLDDALSQFRRPAHDRCSITTFQFLSTFYSIQSGMAATREIVPFSTVSKL